MASFQCFKDAEETYYQQGHNGHHKEREMSYSQTQCYGQSEKRLPMGHGFQAHGHGFQAHGHGHMAQAYGHHDDHAMAKTHNPCMGQNNAHFLGQHAQTHSVAHMKENFSCHGKSKKKGEYEKKQKKITIRRKSKEYKSGDSSCSSDSESDNDRC
ncbi:hypothetical protein BT93_G0296 [Corymbia citriodora subsp. variegata]|nr:hypothetical protein BT93_G0296 [Corymbia citriodora subsp. variegata]KAF8019564.1 hypothetical protein BT93_G0296 [Corymbia citriodora subsp. variegata]